MAQIDIALINLRDGVRSGLHALWHREGIRAGALPETVSECDYGPDIRLFIVGNDSEDASRLLTSVRRIRSAHPHAPIFVLAWTSSERLAIAALKEQVTDYFPPPIAIQEVAAAAARMLASDARANDPEIAGRAIVGNCAAMQSLRSHLVQVARRDCNTLVLGETGTGKDLIAETIHANSPRRKKPFICVNCAAIPDSLLESELFGYERGAFTGASGATEGKIGQAHYGTIFFDEIGEMSPYAQAKILRMVEGKQIQRLGSKGNVAVDVRIIAATNQDLKKLVADQRFRKDLYFRLNVASIELPPLRERRSDIPDLLDHYVRILNRQTGSSVEGFTDQALDCLLRYDWPGNVRELRNVIESIFIDPPDRRIDIAHLPPVGLGALPGATTERAVLLDALQATGWNKSKAAEQLCWSRMKIYRKMAKYKIADVEDCFRA